MRIATFNVNGINGRLPVLLRWLAEAEPDVVCLQELKAASERFPEAAIREAGYGAIWHGQKSWNGVAILARGAEPIETRRGLPGDPDDTHSRYIEAAVNGVLIGCLYLPNGNPAPGPKFDYKLRWFERLAAHAAELLATGAQVVLAGDYNVMPTELDVYKPERWLDDALFRPEVRAAFRDLVAQGWTDALRALHPDERIYTFWEYFRNAWARDAGLRIDHLLLSPAVAHRLVAAGVDREVRGWEKASDHAPAWIELSDGGRIRLLSSQAAPYDGGLTCPIPTAFDLERFVTAQAPVFATALAELKAGREAQPLDVVRLPAAARTGALRDGHALRHRLARRGAGLPRPSAARAAADRVHPHRAGDRGTVAARDLRLAGRPEVLLLDDLVLARGRRGRQCVPAGARPVLRWSRGRTDAGVAGTVAIGPVADLVTNGSVRPAEGAVPRQLQDLGSGPTGQDGRDPIPAACHALAPPRRPRSGAARRVQRSPV